jgi:spermidine/putrescine transport system substrate-binding protein
MARAADLNILCWEGYEAPELLQAFTVDQGITAAGEAFLSDAAAVERILSEERQDWDIVNLNNPYAREVLFPKGAIRPIDKTRFEPHFERMLPQFSNIYRWAYSQDSSELLGICQRFGPFNLVVNTDRMAAKTAEQLGFRLPDERSLDKRYGVLSYDDFNAMHICIGAGLNPFEPQDADTLGRFTATAERWFEGAAIVTGDHLILNDALVRGDIDFYLSGGVYTASPARLAGHDNIRAVTPTSGPIDGKGGIVFMEISSVVENSAACPQAEDFLEYLLSPEVAIRLAFAEGTCNPVTQMGDADVYAAFSADQLKAIQWDTLEEDVGRSAEYSIIPSYAELLPRLQAARRQAGWD